MTACSRRRNRRWPIAAVVFNLLLLCTWAAGQSLPAPSDDDVKAQIAKFQSKAFVQCGTSFYSGAFRVSDLSCGTIQDCEMIREIRVLRVAPQFVPVPGDPISDADALNGLQWRGYISFNESVARIRMRMNGVMKPWGPFQDMKSPLPDGGVPVAGLLKKNGRWFAYDLRNFGQALGSSNQGAPGGNILEMLGGFLTSQTAGGGDIFRMLLGAPPLDDLLATMPQISCADAAAPDGSITSSGKAPLPKTTNTTPPPKMAPLLTDSFQYLSSVPLADREYEGTPEGFGKELRGFIERAASAGGLPPRNYQQEVAFINNVVETCKQITTEMDNSVKGWIGHLGPQYRPCSTLQNVSRQLGTVGRSERGITLWVHPVGGRWGQGFTAEVSFDRLNGDSTLASPIHNGVYDRKAILDDRWARYGIVRGTLRQF